MSSRLMPPNAGAMICNGIDDLLGILCVQTDRNGIHIAEFFKKNAFSFHNRHGSVSAPIFPRPRTALPSDTTATVFAFMV